MNWLIIVGIAILVIIIPIGSIPVTIITFVQPQPPNFEPVSIQVFSERTTLLSYINLLTSETLRYGNLRISISIISENGNAVSSKNYFLTQNTWTIKYPHLISKGDQIRIQIPDKNYDKIMVIPSE